MGMGILGMAEAAAAALILLFAMVSSSAAGETTFSYFDGGYSPLFGGDNVVPSPDRFAVQLKLDRSTGAGFISNYAYHHGFFSADIKLPAGFTAGVVVAFYLSNNNVFERNHDELDFEFLGNKKGREWSLQTNIYGNGSTNRGREERYFFPFDPTEKPHRYAILWTANNIIFYIDDIPIREVIRNEAMGGDFPSKPMSVYATIWDGSAWATDGGKVKANYKYAPFSSEFSRFILHGCRASKIRQIPSTEECAEDEVKLMTADYAVMTPKKRVAMRRFREKHLTYTVCYDSVRYNETFPECDNNPTEQENFWHWGVSKVAAPRRRSTKRRGQGNGAAGGSVGYRGQ